MEMYKPDEHSRHFITHIDAVGDSKTGKPRKIENPQLYFVLCLVWKTRSLREKRAVAWPHVTILDPKRSNFFLRKAGRNTTTVSSPVVMFKKVRTPTTKKLQLKLSRARRDRCSEEGPQYTGQKRVLNECARPR